MVIGQIVAEIRYFPVRVLAAILCSNSIRWNRSGVVGWYLYDFTTRDVYPVPMRRSKQGMECLGSKPRTRFGPVQDGWERIADATDRVNWETALALSEELLRWNRLSMAQGKGGKERLKKGAQMRRDDVLVGVPKRR